MFSQERPREADFRREDLHKSTDPYLVNLGVDGIGWATRFRDQRAML